MRIRKNILAIMHSYDAPYRYLNNKKKNELLFNLRTLFRIQDFFIQFTHEFNLDLLVHLFTQN